MTIGIRLEVDQDPAQDLVDELVRRLVASNEQVAPPSNHRRLAVIARDERHLVGGASGYTNWGWLFVSHLWVDAEHRRKGLGSALMPQVEEAATTRGAGSAHLDTYDFQALGFYRRLGYRIFGELDDYPPGHTRYFLMKTL